MYANLKVMTQVTGKRAHPHNRSPQSFNRYITDSILNSGNKYRVQSHARIQEFLPGGGGGGGEAQLSENSSSFLVLNIVVFQEVRTPYSPSGSAYESKD